MLSITSRLNITRTLGSRMMLGIMLFLCTPYVHAGQVSLAWDANTQPTLGGYQLHYGQTSGNYTANVRVGNTTSYTLASLQDGATYYFALKAHDTTGTIWSGFSNEVSKTIPTSSAAPIASFSANPTSGVAPLTVTFADTSTGTISTRSWAFGDGSTSTATSGAKTYSTLGTYSMSLTVTGPGGSSTATKSITATAAAPVANFTASPTSGTAPLAVSFTNSSTGSISSYAWDFGDGSSSTVQNPSHTYSSMGTYTVNLTAAGPGGTNTQTRTGYVTVASTTGGGSPTGLVAAYNFEEASGTTVVDATGKANHGTISGATRVTQGKFGKALSFDGVNDWVTIKDSASLDLTTGMTLEAWVFPTDHGAGVWRNAIIKERPTGEVYNLYSNVDSNAPTAYTVLSAQPNLAQDARGTAQLPLNTWTHLAATYDGAALRLSVNGTQVGSRLLPGALLTSDGVLRIGGNSIWGEFFQGHIDEVRIYNRALSATEIATNMNTSVAASSPPIFLAGYQTKGAIEDSNPQGRAQAFRTQASVTGWVTSLSVYVDTNSTATKLVAGIYADNNGHPGSRLARGTLSSPGSGVWKSVAIPPVSLKAGTKYWIAILSPSGMLAFRDEGGFVGGLSETSSQSTLTTLPSTWTTGTQVLEGPMSAYGVGYP